MTELAAYKEAPYCIGVKYEAVKLHFLSPCDFAIIRKWNILSLLYMFRLFGNCRKIISSLI